MELPIPHYFLSENAKEFKEREKLLGSILARMGPQDAVKVGLVMFNISDSPLIFSIITPPSLVMREP